MEKARIFYRPRIDRIGLGLLVSIFLLLLTNRTFWSKIHLYLAAQPAAIWMLYLGMAALFTAAVTLLSVGPLAKPVYSLLIVAAAIGSWFTDRFGVVIDADMVRNAFQTTPAEAGHLITTGFLVHMLLFAALPIGLVFWLRTIRRPFLQSAMRKAVVIAACLLVAGGVALGFSKSYATAIRQHKDILQSLNPATPIDGTIKFLMQAGETAYIAAQPIGTDARIVASAPGKPRVTIIVAGETARAANFSLGGYARDTNPELARQDIVYFPKATSCGTATATSIPCMFSMFPRARYSHRKGLENEGLLDVLSHAGADVAWWDNNTGSKGVADRVTFIDLVKIADPRFCADGECQDSVLLDRLDAWLDSVEKDSVLVLHTIGSHGPTYYLRYPPEFRRFTPDCRTAELANCTDAEIVNAYDNTILYTDHVLSTIIDALKARSGTLETSMIYMSDHGESLGENGLYLHGTPYFLAPDFQTHIPFLVWMDPAFMRSTGLDRACMLAAAGKPASHDNLFHSVLGMMNVRTKVYDPGLDVFAGCRKAVSS
ncbi:MAG: phosphoethanolamine--lipid A transferase [Rhizobiaceae bacterium]|nr:phosphoethanolamine--lipid A transferase [Rhizobiaceae bacterium]